MLLFTAIILVLALYMSVLTIARVVESIIDSGNVTIELIVTSILWGIFYYLTNMQPF